MQRILGLGLLSILIFSSPAFAQNNDMRSLMSRMDQIQRQMDTVSRQVYSGNPPPAAMSGTTTPNNSGMAAALDERMGSIEGSLRQINGRLEEQEHSLNQLRSEFDLFKTDLEMRLNEMSASRPSIMPSASSPSGDESPRMSQMTDTNAQTAAMANDNSPRDDGSQNLPSQNAAALYDASFQALREQRYDRAEAGFKEFIERFGSDTLAGNAQYWLGETYYVRGNFTEAAKTFAQGYHKYPKSSKGPDNLLKLGLSLAQNGKKQEACVTLQQLALQYPSVAPAVKQRADDEQNKLGCNA